MIYILTTGSAIRWAVLLVVLVINGCSTHTKAPVEQRVSKKTYYNKYNKGYRQNYKSRYYKVKKGDTLYSIAWAYALDFRELARLNRIKHPYTIYAGQHLLVQKSIIKKIKTTVKKQPTKKKYTLKKKKSRDKTKTTTKNNTQKTTTKKTNKKTVETTKTDKYKGSLKWVWPIKGKVIEKFNPRKGNKGIDIAVNRIGKTIRAAEAGKVVYSGHGLTGYGYLVIIKHNQNFLSAYAHNSRLLVEEGSWIKRNQEIALSGKTAAERVKLHFEIRQNGKPVNPLKYLP